MNQVRIESATPGIHLAEDLDPFTLDVIKNGLAAVADEMAATIMRTARSYVVKEALDFSTALFNAEGEIIAQGTCLPLHLGAMPYAVSAAREAFRNDLREGDVYAMNDPWDGSTHLPDVVCVKPVFVDHHLVGFATALAHQTDIGGRVAGGNASDSTEIYQEGLRLPPVRIYEAGEPVEAIFKIIERNVRVPVTVLGDIRSQIAACAIGERQLIAMVEQYGREAFAQYCQALLDYTERFTRSEIEKLPDGVYHFEDYLDDDGIDPDPIIFKVAVTVDGDQMCIDFDGTAPQVKGAINSVYAFSASASWACVRSILDRNIPNNAGYFRPIEVRTPERSIVNPQPPAPVAARGLTGVRIADCVMGALAQIVPHLVPASGASAPETGVCLGGYRSNGEPFVYLEFMVGSWGGGPHRDGMDGCTGVVVNYANTPIELVESEQPLLIERYGLVPDSGGPGRLRGGLAIEKHFRFMEKEGIAQIRSDRRRFAPYGLDGGDVGGHSQVRIRRKGTEMEQVPSKFLTQLGKDDVLEVRLPSGGGFGPARERDPQRVLDDVISGKVSIDQAREYYGVVVTTEPLAVSLDATRQLRGGIDE